MGRRRSLGRIGTVLVKAAVWLVIFALAGEAGARLFLTSPSVQRFDPELGYVNAPGSHDFQSREGFQRIALNELGLNDRPIAPKPAGTRRLLFLGDSMTFAEQVAPERNFTRWVERLSPRAQSVDGGRDAVGPNQWPVLYDRLVPAVKPDLVVVVMSRGDVFDLVQSGATIVNDDRGRPVGVINRPSAKDQMQADLGPLLQRSALATYLARRAASMTAQTQGGSSWFARLVLRRGKPAAAHRNSAAETLPPDAARRLAAVFQVMAAKGPVVFVSLPSLEYFPGGRATYEPRSRLEAPVFHRAAALAGVRFYDLTGDMAAAYAASGRPLAGFATSRLGEGHLNAYGHEVVGRAMARDLAPALPTAVG